MYPQESISPDGESTAPPSDRSDRSSGQLTSEGRGSGVLQGGTGGHSSEVGGRGLYSNNVCKVSDLITKHNNIISSTN